MSLPKKNLASSGFGGFNAYDIHLKEAHAAILPVPYDGTVCYKKGTRFGPKAIIEAAPQVEFYDVQWGIDCEELILPILDEVEPAATGPSDTLEKVRRAYRSALDTAPFVLMLGGEHSITTAAIQVLAEKYNGTLSVLQFDAHADLRDSYQGVKHSHACVMRRVVDLAPITQVGIRNVSKEEEEFIETSRHPLFYAWDIAGNNDWIERMVDGLKENVYITFDLDGLDPSVAPGVGSPEPGGMMWQDAVDAIKRVGEKRNIVGADVVELLPVPDFAQSEFAAAKLCFKILAAAFLLK